MIGIRQDRPPRSCGRCANARYGTHATWLDGERPCTIADYVEASTIALPHDWLPGGGPRVTQFSSSMIRCRNARTRVAIDTR